MYYEKIEQASKDELQSLQLDRLKWSLHHAYANVSMYKNKFDAHGVHPDNLVYLEDLKKFPFTTKEDLRQNYPFNTFAVPENKVVRVHASSGTTGKPTVVGYTKKDIETWSSVVARSIYAAGGRAGSKIQVSYGYGLFTGGLGAHYGAEKLGAMVIPMSSGNTAKQVQILQDFQAEIIMVTPSYFLNLIDSMKKSDIDLNSINLKTGIFGAEPWTNNMRTQIEKDVGIDATDIYGLSEMFGPGVGQECIESKDGPTIWEDHFYPEVVDRETLKSLPDGEQGELVFTSLTKEAMPIIRYRTRDLTKLQAGTSRTMRRIEKITGRSDDMLIIKGVNVFPSQVEEQILKFNSFSYHYQLEVSNSNNSSINHLTVKVEPANNNNLADAQADRLNLAENIKNYIGIWATVELCECNTIARSEGKAQRVVDVS